MAIASFIARARSQFVLSAFIVVLAAGAPQFATCANCTRPTKLPAQESGEPRNIDGLKSELNYYKCSGTYDRDFSRVIDKAISYVIHRSMKGTNLALVLDIDETSLSNWEEIRVNAHFGFISEGTCTSPKGPCGDEAWKLLANAQPLATIRLFKIARKNNIAIFFISGRALFLREATEANLHRAGYSDWAELMLVQPGNTLTIQQFKTEKRKEITARGFTIIANVGDQHSDLKGGYAERVFKVPNAFYFIPSTLVPSGCVQGTNDCKTNN